MAADGCRLVGWLAVLVLLGGYVAFEYLLKPASDDCFPELRCTVSSRPEQNQERAEELNVSSANEGRLAENPSRRIAVGDFCRADRTIRQQLCGFCWLGAGVCGRRLGDGAARLRSALADSSRMLICLQDDCLGRGITVAFLLNARVTFGASIRHSRFFNYLLIQGLVV